MAILSKIAKSIDKSSIDWLTIAKEVGFDQLLINDIKSKRKSTKKFVNYLTIGIWKDILKHFGIHSVIGDNLDVPGIYQLANMMTESTDVQLNDTEQLNDTLNEDQTQVIDTNLMTETTDVLFEQIEETLNKKQIQNIDIMHEVSLRVGDWKAFARVLGFTQAYITNYEMNSQISMTTDVFQMNVERNKHLMNEARPIFNKKNLKTNYQSWTFWRNQLQQFDNGREVIKDIERFFPELIAEVSKDFAHVTTTDKMTYIGHPIQHKSFQIDKNGSDIPVSIGSNDIKMTAFQDLPEWLETQDRYMEIFNLFKDKVALNFYDLEENCPILHTLEEFINDGEGKGFAAKGYHLVDHLHLFDQRVFINVEKYQHYFCFLANDNIAINFIKCGKEPGHALYYSSQNIQIVNALHKEFQSKDVIQVNVLVQKEEENINFCPGCKENSLCIDEEVLTDITKFKSWFSKLQKLLHEVKQKLNISSLQSNGNILETLKKDMITHEALQNTDAFPSFSSLAEDQMNEMPKVILLTGLQLTILHSKQKHIMVRGPYGSGKSIVLTRKLDKCIESMNEKDIVYYICHDQQSGFSKFIKYVKDDHPSKNIITCNSTNLPCGERKPSLSFILNHILTYWKDKTVHLFIDEFSGIYITEQEIIELKELLPKFSECNIVISLQSMEESLHKGTNVIDLGYQYDSLERNTSFVVFNLDYCLRCSVEINEFVSCSSNFIEKNEVPIRSIENFYDDGKNLFVDREYGQEMNFKNKDMSVKKDMACIETKLSYNLWNKCGHFSRNGPVMMYGYDKYSHLPDDSLPVPQFYISVLEHVLENNSQDEKFVICTFDEQLYSSVYYHLEKEHIDTWTSDIEKFIEGNSRYNIFLTDYASVRGFEFPNFVFLFRMGTKYLKYRMIECFTRATTKLQIITDNINTSDQMSLDNQLFEIWKSLPCVSYFDCKYDHSKDSLEILQEDNTLFSKICLSEIPVGALQKFPWNMPKKLHDEDSHRRSEDDIFLVFRYLCQNENVNVIQEFSKTHEINILKYRDPDSRQNLLHISSMTGSVKVTKFLLEEYQFDVESKDLFRQTPLHLASLYGCVDVVELLLQYNADIHARNNYKETPLHHAASKSHVKVVECLVNNNALVDVFEKSGRTPLHVAVLFRHFEVTKFLIGNKADINKGELYYGATPLHFAVANGDVKTIKLLIHNKADFDKADENGETSLSLAAISGLVDIVKAFIEKRDYFNTLSFDFEQPLLKKDTSSGHFEVAKLLIKANTDLSMAASKRLFHFALNNDIFDVVELFIKSQKIDINMLMVKKKTLLHVASSKGYLHIVNLLLDNNVDVNVIDDSGETPLHYAASHGFTDIAKLLINDKANVNAKADFGSTPLHNAASNGHNDIILLLIENKADINLKNDNGETPLFVAAARNNSKVVKSLVDNKAEINLKDHNGKTPLHQAAYYSIFDNAKCLIDGNADVNAIDCYGDTPLHIVGYDNSKDSYYSEKGYIFKLLIKNNSNIMARNNNGKLPVVLNERHDRGLYDVFYNLCVNENMNVIQEFSKQYEINILKYCDRDSRQNLLHISSMTGSVKITKFLAEEFQFDVESKNSDGNTPLHLASYYGCIDVVELLLQYNADIHARNNYKETPLHHAASKGHVKVVKCLVNNHAVVNVVEKYGDTPLHKAVNHGHFEVVDFLIEK